MLREPKERLLFGMKDFKLRKTSDGKTELDFTGPVPKLFGRQFPARLFNGGPSGLVTDSDQQEEFDVSYDVPAETIKDSAILDIHVGFKVLASQGDQLGVALKAGGLTLAGIPLQQVNADDLASIRATVWIPDRSRSLFVETKVCLFSQPGAVTPVDRIKTINIPDGFSRDIKIHAGAQWDVASANNSVLLTHLAVSNK